MTFTTANNRLATIGSWNATGAYDAAGNLTTDDSAHTYQWDGEGRLKSVDSGSSATYTYNALGKRVEDVIPGYRVEYLYDAFGREMGSYDANGAAWWNRYIPLGGQPLGKYLGTSTYFFHTNRLGSTGMVSDHTGTVTQKELYYPFGQLWVTGGSGVTRRFASLQEPLPNSGPEIYAAPFRSYQSRLYRWLSPDPLGGDISNPQTLNRYAYVLNNPTNFIDPLGLDDCTVDPDGMPNCGTISTTSSAPFLPDDANTVDWSSFIDLWNHSPSPWSSQEPGGRGGAGGGWGRSQVDRTFQKTFTCEKSPAQLVAAVKQDFSSLASYQDGGTYAIVAPEPIAQGETIPITTTLNLPLIPRAFTSEDDAVVVSSARGTGWTFTAVPGQHPFRPGTVDFNAAGAGPG